MLTLLALHGSSRDESDLVLFATQIAPEARLIAPRGSISQGDGYTFFMRRPDGSIDSAEVLIRAELWLKDNVACVLPADGETIVVGYSSGAIFAEALLTIAPHRFVGAVLLRPQPLAPEYSFPAMPGKPVVLLAGRQDERRLSDDAARLAEQLVAADADVTLHLLDAGHDWAPHSEDAVLTRSWLMNITGG